jgi:hypothetical protein
MIEQASQTRGLIQQQEITERPQDEWARQKAFERQNTHPFGQWRSLRRLSLLDLCPGAFEQLAELHA